MMDPSHARNLLGLLGVMRNIVPLAAALGVTEERSAEIARPGLEALHKHWDDIHAMLNPPPEPER